MLLWTPSKVLLNQTRKTEKDAKNAESKELPSGSPKLAELLAMKLDRINQVYRSVDEKRAIQTAGIGEPINAAIKVERLEDVTLSSSSQISLGYLKIPVSSISALLSNILRSPKILISLHQREYEAVSEEKSRLFLVAKMTGTTEDHSWLVDCPESLENNPSGKDRTVEDMVTEMAHRIFATLQADATGQSINWKAMWKYNEGLRAYRDCLHATKKHKYFLNTAEKKFIGAIEEQERFSLAYYNLGVVYAEIDQLGAAKNCFQDAIDVDPQQWEPYYAKGIAAFIWGKEWEGKNEILTRCLNRKTDDSEKCNKKRVEESYIEAIDMCKRVREIKSREERALKRDLSLKAKSYDLEGNAQSRLACLSCLAKDIECGICQSNNSGRLWEAKESLEKAVNYSWMALIKESVLHETTDDESSIVSECSLDLADIYIKMSKCPNCKADYLISNAISVLKLAIYVNPYDINLYHLLGMAVECQKGDKSKNYKKLIYDYALRMKPEDSRIRAHIASINAEDDSESVRWLKECEKFSFISDGGYENVFNFLEKIIKDERDSGFNIPDGDNLLSRELCYAREKLEADLKNFSIKGGAISSVIGKDLACHNDCPKVCLELSRMTRYIEEDTQVKCIYPAIQCIQYRLSIKENGDPKALWELYKNSCKSPKLIEDIFVLGSLLIELAGKKAKDYLMKLGTKSQKPGDYELIMRRSRSYFDILIDILKSEDTRINGLKRSDDKKYNAFIKFYKIEDIPLSY